MITYQIVNLFSRHTSTGSAIKILFIKNLMNESIQLDLYPTWTWWTSSSESILGLSRCSMRILSISPQPTVARRDRESAWTFSEWGMWKISKWSKYDCRDLSLCRYLKRIGFQTTYFSQNCPTMSYESVNTHGCFILRSLAIFNPTVGTSCST